MPVFWQPEALAYEVKDNEDMFVGLDLPEGKGSIRINGNYSG
jgi:hypothetical protein